MSGLREAVARDRALAADPEISKELEDLEKTALAVGDNETLADTLRLDEPLAFHPEEAVELAHRVRTLSTGHILVWLVAAIPPMVGLLTWMSEQVNFVVLAQLLEAPAAVLTLGPALVYDELGLIPFNLLATRGPKVLGSAGLAEAVYYLSDSFLLMLVGYLVLGGVRLIRRLARSFRPA